MDHMGWLEEKKDWLPNSRNTRKARQPEKEPEKVYSVAEVAHLMSVSKNTVYKWLCIDHPEDAVIPPSGWFRIANTTEIRIKKWALMALLKEA